MAFSPGSPITGAAVTGLTTPTYTIALDGVTFNNGKQYAVTALGGTQTGVDVNTVSKPFTIAFFRPQVLRALPAANPTTGIVRDVPVNKYSLVLRKGAQPAANQTNRTMLIKVSFEVPAGVDTYESEEVKAAMSCLGGLLSSSADGICSTLLTGVV